MSAGPGSRPMSAASAEAYQRLHAHLAVLRLAAAAEALPGLVEAARRDGLGAVEALERLLAVEVAATEARRLASRLHFACLPSAATLAEFDFAAQPGIDEALVRELASLRFLDDAGNVLFVGPPGTGKTMLAVILARGAAEAGHRAYFTTAADLAARFARAAREGRWASCLRFFCGPRLLVIDEFAYARDRADPEATSALFEVIARRYLKSSTIVTSHAGVAAWGERLGDAMLAAALLDRLLHRGIVVAIDGPSYRMRATSSAATRCAGRSARRRAHEGHQHPGVPMVRGAVPGPGEQPAPALLLAALPGRRLALSSRPACGRRIGNGVPGRRSRRERRSRSERRRGSHRRRRRPLSALPPAGGGAQRPGAARGRGRRDSGGAGPRTRGVRGCVRGHRRRLGACLPRASSSPTAPVRAAHGTGDEVIDGVNTTAILAVGLGKMI